jgi:hypothetical protein
MNWIRKVGEPMRDEDPQLTALQAALNHRAETSESIVTHVESVVRAAENGRCRANRNRKLSALVLSVCVLVGIAGLVQIRLRARPQEQAVNTELRLIPEYVPVQESQLTVDPASWSQTRPGWSSTWGSPQTEVVHVEVIEATVETPLFPLDLAIAGGQAPLPAGVPKSDIKTLEWTVDTGSRSWVVDLALPASTSWAEQIAIARSLSIDNATGRLTSSKLPLGLPLADSHASQDDVPLRTWYLSGPDIGLDAMLPNPRQSKKSLEALAGLYPGVPKPVRVRGHKGYLIHDGASSNPNVPLVLVWAEDGWYLGLRLSGSATPTPAEIVRIAESLRPATDVEWAKLQDGLGLIAPKRLTPDVTDVFAGSGAIAGQKWSLQFANSVTDKGCLNIDVDLDGSNRRCVPLTGQPILWSSIRKLGGTDEVLIALLSSSVDTIVVEGMVVGGADEDGEIVPEGQHVTNGNSETYVQWIVVPVRAGQGVSIQAFRNVPGPDNAESNNADSNNAESDTSADIASELIGTFPVSR